MVWAALSAVHCKLFQQTQQNKTVCQASKVACQTAVLYRFVFKRLFAAIRAARVVAKIRVRFSEWEIQSRIFLESMHGKSETRVISVLFRVWSHFFRVASTNKTAAEAPSGAWDLMSNTRSIVKAILPKTTRRINAIFNLGFELILWVVLAFFMCSCKFVLLNRSAL